MNRRFFLQGCLGSTAVMGMGLPSTANATVRAADRKFVFVYNQGGWDPTRVFATTFSNPMVDMEADAEQATSGGISWVSHPDRPNVDAFFADNASNMLIVNGMLVRSIAHDICTMLSLTGSTSGLSPGWPAIIAAATASQYTLPHLVLGGPSFPGELGAVVARSGSNGQLEGLLSGEILKQSDVATTSLSQPAQSTIDQYLLRRAAARSIGGRAPVDDALSMAYADALDKSVALKDYRYVMDFTGGTDLASQAAVAVDALQVGLSRCVTLGHPVGLTGLGWDSHADNDAAQSPLFESLFTGLGQLMSMLRTTPGTVGASLADETVVVVLSEMGRTAQLNATNGKDHWPYTSAMIVGPGFTTDRVIGGYDDGYYGQNIDPNSATLDENGRILSAEALGATLLAAADIDPAAHIMDADPILGVLT